MDTGNGRPPGKEQKIYRVMTGTNRVYAIYCRTNRRVKWEYSAYCGRWETKEEALQKVKDFYGDQPFEYLIQTIGTQHTETGMVNWTQPDRKERRCNA